MKHILAAAIAATTASHAAISINLPGNSETSGWDQLNNTNPYWAANAYPTAYPGSAAWPAPVAANMAGSSGGAVLMKESGNGYLSGSSIYDAGAAGTFSITDQSPLGGLSTIVFQADVGTSLGVLPVLHFNGGNQSLAPDFAALVDGDYLTFDFQTGALFPTSNHAWQWDLSGLGVTSYEILWGSVPDNHLTQYEFNLTTGDTFAQAIPEPSSAVLIALVPIILLRRHR